MRLTKRELTWRLHTLEQEAEHEVTLRYIRDKQDMDTNEKLAHHCPEYNWLVCKLYGGKHAKRKNKKIA